MNRIFQKLFQKRILLISISFLFFFSCKDNDDNNTSTTVSAKTIEINNFVWRGLNSWYLWQEDVPNLADSKLNTNYNSFISSNNSSENFFYSLLNNYPTTDRFSWIVQDYDELFKQFQGSTTDYGMDYSLSLFAENKPEVFGYVNFVLPNSPAENAGFKRGDIFIEVNGSQLLTSNYQKLLFENNSGSFSIATIQNNTIVKNGIVKTANKSEITENPVLMSKVITEGSNKIGYLVYNGFTYTYNDELNEVFTNFKSQGVKELVLDLRYNGGGSVESCNYLASMITGQFTNQVFGNEIFNSKHQGQNETLKFTNTLKVYNKNGDFSNEKPISSLNLTKIYVLTSYATASASELIINGLNPYISVTLIGNTTRGKNVGSITLLDAPKKDFAPELESDINPNHKYAMQPLVFKITNSAGFSDYADGFKANHVINEAKYVANLQPLGELTEPMLAKAVDLIAGTNYYEPIKKDRRINNDYKVINTSSSATFVGSNMYKLPFKNK